MFNTDKPINEISEDQLGRGVFAEQLARAIMQFKTKDNYAISLQGKWGSGKTSVLNMAIDEIKKLSEQMDNNEKVIIIQFNPWNFTDTSQLINQFFVTLTNALKLESREDKVQKVGAAIENYSSALEYSEYIPVVGKYLKLIPKLAASWGKKLKDNAENKQNDVVYRKRQVENALKVLDLKILIVIDDIDRLSNEQIQLIFQLVNAVAGFPNVIYLLSFDRDIVVRALGEIQHCNGADYLEKIIQVPFDIPPLNISKLHKILFNELEGLIELPSGTGFDTNRWSDVFQSCISPFIKTLRDVNRFCNMLSFRYSTVKDEVDFIDMAGISALRIFASPIFEWIRENKFSLVGGYSGGGISLNGVEESKKERLSQFREIYPESPQIAINAVASLFPQFSNKNSYSSNYSTIDEIHQAMRIASETKFDIYFSLTLESIKISRKEVDESLLYMDDTPLRAYIKMLSENGLYDSFLNEVRLNLSRIPEKRIGLLLSILIFSSGKVDDIKSSLMGAELGRINIYIISDMLYKISDEKDRFNIIKNMFLNSDFLSFQFLLELLHLIELTYGRIAETDYKTDEKLISMEHLSELELIFLDRTKSLVKKENLLDWKEKGRVSFIWKYTEKSTYDEYIKSILVEELNIIKFITLFANTWSSGNQVSRYEFSDESFSEYISGEEIIKIIERIRMKKEFWELDQKIIETAIAFILAQEILDGKKLIEIKEIKVKRDVWEKEFLEKAE